jgi:hypothetical protein
MDGRRVVIGSPRWSRASQRSGLAAANESDCASPPPQHTDNKKFFGKDKVRTMIEPSYKGNVRKSAPLCHDSSSSTYRHHPRDPLLIHSSLQVPSRVDCGPPTPE